MRGNRIIAAVTRRYRTKGRVLGATPERIPTRGAEARLCPDRFPAPPPAATSCSPRGLSFPSLPEFRPQLHALLPGPFGGGCNARETGAQPRSTARGRGGGVSWYYSTSRLRSGTRRCLCPGGVPRCRLQPSTQPHGSSLGGGGTRSYLPGPRLRWRRGAAGAGRGR